MRTIKRGRGLGTYFAYIAWHRVGRGDPATSGRSHLPRLRGSHRDLPNCGKLDCFLFSTFFPNVDDSREQFPLALLSAPHELAGYDVRFASRTHAGTLEIAKQLGFKHPRVNGGGLSDHRVVTTDLLLTLLRPDGHLELLALSVKPAGVQKIARQTAGDDTACGSAGSTST